MRLITSTRRDILEREQAARQAQRTFFAWFYIVVALCIMGGAVSQCRKQRATYHIPATIEASPAP